MQDYTVNVFEIAMMAIKWIVGTLATLFISFLAFLAKKHIDNIEEVKKSLSLIIQEHAILKSQIRHLEANMKTGFSGQQQLLEDVINLEKENIRLDSRIENLENGHK